jgi:O-antigen ligase
VVAVASLLAAVAGTEHMALAVLPVLLVAGVYAATKVPLRYPALVLVLILLAVDDREGKHGQWQTPLVGLGDLMHGRIDTVLGIPGLPITGMEAVLALLMAIWLQRWLTRSRIDAAGRSEPASVLRRVLALYVGGVAFAAIVGLSRGLPLAPWKLRNLLHPILLALFFLAAFRGARDHRSIGRLIVVAACVRAVLAIVVQWIAVAETGGRFAHATSHGDSVLFAVAIVLVAAGLLERPTRQRLSWAVPVLLLLLIGAAENQRRIVWVMLLMAFGALYLFSPMKGWKASVTRLLLLAAPVVALYVGVGWNRGSKVFAPVQTLRSVVDTSADRSAYWREVENWNIAMTMRQMPLLGLGLGGQYTEFMPNDDVSEGYKEFREWPHNSFLGLLLLMGLFGFSAVSLLLALVVFLSVRSYRLAASLDQRVAALGCLAAVVSCQVLAWGDTGAHYPQYKVLAALAVAISARLAVATGAWPARGAGGGRAA